MVSSLIFRVGKTDGCLYTGIDEHAKSDQSKVCNHVHDCEHFEHVLSLPNLPANLLDIKFTVSVVDLIFDNCCVNGRFND